MIKRPGGRIGDRPGEPTEADFGEALALLSGHFFSDFALAPGVRSGSALAGCLPLRRGHQCGDEGRQSSPRLAPSGTGSTARIDRGGQTAILSTSSSVSSSSRWSYKGPSVIDRPFHANLQPHSRSIRSTSSGSRRKSKTSRSARMWSASVVPVRGTMPTSRANRKTIWLTVRPWRSAIRASSGRASASRLAVSSEKPW